MLTQTGLNLGKWSTSKVRAFCELKTMNRDPKTKGFQIQGILKTLGTTFYDSLLEDPSLEYTIASSIALDKEYCPLS